MSKYRPAYQEGGVEIEIPIDAETLKGNAVETKGIDSNSDTTIPTTKQIKEYVDNKIDVLDSAKQNTHHLYEHVILIDDKIFEGEVFLYVIFKTALPASSYSGLNLQDVLKPNVTYQCYGNVSIYSNIWDGVGLLKITEFIAQDGAEIFPKPSGHNTTFSLQGKESFSFISSNQLF